MKRLLCAAFVLVGCNQTGPARVDVAVDSAAGEVAFELAGPGGAALVIPVHLNGNGPYTFVLDTGATLTCLDQSIADDLQLPEVRGVLGTAAGVGGQGRLELVSIDSLRLGGVSAHDLQACVIDLEHLSGIGVDLDGLIGLNVLKEFHVALDFERSIVTFTDP